METAKTIAQIVYYLALSITGPLALVAFLRARKSDREEREHRTYDELDNRFFEYQKLALEYYELDILDVPNSDPSLAFDKKRKQEMVAHAILFSLFERAYLMFCNQADSFQKRQWSGWKHFLADFLRRDAVRAAWQMSKATYDTGFQAFMDKRISEIMSGGDATAPAMACPTAPVAEAREMTIPRAAEIPVAVPAELVATAEHPVSPEMMPGRIQSQT